MKSIGHAVVLVAFLGVATAAAFSDSTTFCTVLALAWTAVLLADKYLRKD